MVKKNFTMWNDTCTADLQTSMGSIIFLLHTGFIVLTFLIVSLISFIF